MKYTFYNCAGSLIHVPYFLHLIKCNGRVKKNIIHIFYLNHCLFYVKSTPAYLKSYPAAKLTGYIEFTFVEIRSFFIMRLLNYFACKV